MKSEMLADRYFGFAPLRQEGATVDFYNGGRKYQKLSESELADIRAEDAARWASYSDFAKEMASKLSEGLLTSQGFHESLVRDIMTIEIALRKKIAEEG